MIDIGILGDGQLGQLTAIEAKKMGISTIIFGEGGKQSPSGQVSDILDSDGYDHNSSSVDALISLQPEVITMEWENIPLDLLKELESKGISVKPGSNIFHLITNRLNEKRLIRELGHKTTNFFPVNCKSDLKEAFIESGTGLLKTCRGGYDGRGQEVIKSKNDIEQIESDIEGKELIYEQIVNFKMEISVIVGRRNNGEMVVFEPAENIHKNGILLETITPARIDDEIKIKAKDIAMHITESLGIEGLLTIEMFLLEDGSILISELAPRPHNSGHPTIESYTQSQYKILIKALLDENFGELELLQKTRMKNLIGNDILDIPQNTISSGNSITKIGKSTVYDYGKREVRPGRKMGHVTTILN